MKSEPRSHGRGAGMGTGPSRLGSSLSGRIWVERDGETFLAWGRVVLLERIQECGSIHGAAKSMGMGYRHAWDLVEQMNRLAPRPLVEKTTGGRGGGGSRLTKEGEATVKNFWKLVKEFKAWLADRDPRLWMAGLDREA